MELTYNGNTLPSTITNQLVNFARNDLNVPPSYLITKLHYEGLWGGSSVAQSENNWGGMTWVDSWPSPYTRESGVTVTRGSARPAIEGGYYIRYASVDDFIIDWSHLIRRGGIYNVADSETFALAVKGMFVVGGADYDYATMNVEGSQLRYELYLEGMEARRSAINQSNANALDELDGGSGPIDPDPEEPIDPDPEPIDPTELLLVIEQMFMNLYNYSKDGYFGNAYIKGQKQLNNMYKLTMTQAFKDKISGFTVPDQPTDPTDPTDPTEPTTTPHYPVMVGTPITDRYGDRINPVTGEPELHNGTDWGGALNDPIFAIMDGEVIANDYNDLRGNWVMIQHTDDAYYSKYLHLNLSNVEMGQLVKKGDVIGYMGTTGQSTGVHLHLSIGTTAEGNWIDPEVYLQG